MCSSSFLNCLAWTVKNASMPVRRRRRGYIRLCRLTRVVGEVMMAGARP